MYSNEQLRCLFQSQFNLQDWNKFVLDVIKPTSYRQTPEPLDFDPAIGNGYYLGQKKTSDNYEIGLFYLKLNNSVKNRRVGLRQLVKPYLRFLVDAALVVFDDGDRWRLSFICDIKGESTAPKRYTFVFGEHDNYYNTAVSRFVGLQSTGVSFASLKDAFSVEALTKEFYNELFDWYQRAVDPNSGIYFPNNTETSEDDFEDIDKKIIRLITRLMFVWFIKQKGLVPDRLFEEKELKGILINFDPLSTEQGNYYNAILQNLFFATLNRAIEDEEGKRGFAELKGQRDVKTLYRYAEMFNMGKEEVLKLFAEVPFLNGGLFECLDKTKKIDGVETAYNYDGFSRNDFIANGRYRHRAFIPNKFFFEPEQGLLSILKRYNFTIEENTPNEQQVALDPELLGKVFENLLGAYNPETKETARNQSGSFYTPREIVSYMVDESLIAYLGDTPLVRSMFKDDFEPDELHWSDYQLIAGKLKSVKVLDPACGSGAFPMGLLNRIVELLQKIETDKTTYELKLNIIENCIYGSDIQSIAAQITKLRFFISLICDCEKDASKPNFGIPTLPNLETKFVTANSLIGLHKVKEGEFVGSLFEDPEIGATKDALRNVRHEHFKAKTASAKQRLRKQDEELRQKLAHLLSEDNDYASEDAKQMAAWNPYDQNAVSPFFDSEWMFGVTDGFDIVIGNPPYISTKGVKEEEKKAYEKEFGFSDDTYNLFTFKGLSLTKANGSLTYIIPKTFWTTQTKRNMRDLLLSKKIRYIFDTANPFESVMVDTCIIQVINSPFQSSHMIKFRDGSKDLHKPIDFAPIRQSMYINTQNAVIFKPTELNLKIWDLYGEKVKALYDKWWDKIKTSRDIEKNKAELEAYRASLKPGDVALLGCLTEGGQGLATANNGKYIAIRKTSKWAENVYASRPKKLAEAISKKPKISGYINGLSPQEFLAVATEKTIAETFDRIKEDFGRDIFGQGYIFRLIDDEEIADVDSLTEDEKENGISTDKPYYVPYDKGDKDGNRWYLETPFAIAWSKENVRFFKTNSGKKGEGMPVVRNPQFYFKEGLCWSDINTTFLKCRKKQKSINDVKSMSLFEMTVKVPEAFIICIINSTFMSHYVDDFVNNTQTFQINDARQLPFVIPDKAILSEFTEICKRAIEIKIHNNDETALQNIQSDLDCKTMALYCLS